MTLRTSPARSTSSLRVLRAASAWGTLVLLAAACESTPANGTAASASSAQAPGVGAASAIASSAGSATTSASAVSSSSAAPTASSSGAKAGKADPKAVSKALLDGRAKVKDKDLEGGLAAFEAGLKDAPKDATLLGEAAWTAFRLDKNDKAAEYVKRGLAVAGAGVTRARSLYTAGRVAEKKGDKEVARASYASSLALRARKTSEAAISLGRQELEGGPNW
jgi:tetratricopeptide (TPR) repeat protein